MVRVSVDALVRQHPRIWSAGLSSDAGERKEVGPWDDFPVSGCCRLMCPKNERDRDLVSLFYRLEVGETTWKYFMSYHSKSRKASMVVGIFRQREHSTIMMYPPVLDMFEARRRIFP